MWRAMISSLLMRLPIYLLLLSIRGLKVEADDSDATILGQPGCNHTCGDVLIPFPFGIGNGCFLDHWFEIDCKPPPNSNSSISKPFLSKLNFEVIEVNLARHGHFSTMKVAIPPMNVCSSDTQIPFDLSGNGIPYYFSREDNVFFMEGCPGSAVLVNQSNMVMAGCGTVCHNNNTAIQTKDCYGVRCCQTPLPSRRNSNSPLQFYKINFNPLSSGESSNCLLATIIESDSVSEYFGELSSSVPPSWVPVVLLWSWTSNLPYNPHMVCDLDKYNRTYCRCKDGYYGNPYVSNGCQVPQECKGCRGYCSGEWDITGNLTNPETYYCESGALFNFATIIGVSNSLGIVFSVIGLYGLYRLVKRRSGKKQRAKFFRCNGGLLLKQQLSSSGGVVERTKIFSMKELDKATDHFNENRILGQGGQGTVYKGMLTDGRIVAVKKSKLLDESQLQQFINEVVILSQVNHRNVVKLLGCCLETKVPLLVYEFVSNGTLHQHIHHPDEEFVISWEMCLKIAADSASAVSYLHSSSSNPVFHRDIKTANILLDEKHRAKVSDFGSSKTIANDKTHVTTLVQGTMGYLDPEYFQSYQITEKSDVYSFGVVLLELLTRKKPIYRDASTMEQKNLVTEFLFMSENSRLSEILDPKILEEAKEYEVMSTVELARRCISWSGKLRPTMKEVAMTLEMIMKSPSQVLRWYREQEALPNSDAGFDEYVMGGISDAEFTSSTLTDVLPHLPDTQ